MTECVAILFCGSRDKSYAAGRHQAGNVCCANASFTSRGKPCCWVHYQADTRGPRAGKVEWAKVKR